MIIFPITILLVLNFWFFKSVFWGLVLGFFYFLFLSQKLAQKFTPKLNLLFSLLLVLSLISLIGAGAYFLYQLNDLVVAMILLALPPLIHKFPKQKREQIETINNQRSTNYPLLRPEHKNFLTLAYLFFAFILFRFLFIFQTTEAIRSPWKIISGEFFIFYFLATLILLIVILNSRKKIYLSLISIHFLISSSVALIIYKLGYGFDQFIHQAAEKVIMAQGAIYPKTIYYLGQYSLVTILSKIFNINHIWVDKLLVISLFSVFLPIIIYISFRKIITRDNIALVLPLLFLLFPISSFIVTTPQNLANLFILFIIFSSLPCLAGKENWLLPISILTLTTLAIHPLVGIPAIIFLSVVLSTRYFVPRIIKVLLFTIGSIIIPLIFLINSYLSGLKINLSLIDREEILKSLYGLKPYFVNNFNLIFDFVYFYKFNFYILLFLLSIIILLLNREKTKIFFPYITSFAIFFINFLILKLLFSFSFLIEYEQSDYTNRVLQISFFFLLPIIFYGLTKLIKKLVQQKIHLKILFIIFAASLITASLYISYPRSDDYETSHSLNTTDTDIKTVHWINEDSQENNFIVLANQQVSVAAIQEFGFKKYFNNQFYYAIPTGSPLYQYYLKMVNDNPKKEYMREAMNEVGVEQGYFVINSYWWRAKEITEEAKKTADSYKIIDGEKSVIFKYLK